MSNVNDAPTPCEYPEFYKDLETLQTQDETHAHYKKWAPKYDADLESGAYKAYIGAGNVVLSLMADADAKAKTRILDLGAGTGLLGLYLQENGCGNIDALEPCDEMVDIALQKGVAYKNVWREFVKIDQPFSFPERSYDIVAGSGVFRQGHMDESYISTVARAVKRGGYFVFNTNQRDGNAIRMRAKIERLAAEEGVFDIVRDTEYENHVGNQPGQCWLLKIR